MNIVLQGGESLKRKFFVKWYAEFGNHSIDGTSLVFAQTKNEAIHLLKLSLFTELKIPFSSVTVKNVQYIGNASYSSNESQQK